MKQIIKGEIEQLADEVFTPDQIGAGPASGSYRTHGMLIVPCSMKTAAGICSGYADNLILRAADVTIKEQRSSGAGGKGNAVKPDSSQKSCGIIQDAGSPDHSADDDFYQRPETIDDMVRHMAARLLEPFGIETEGYRRWKGI